jgi:hypothetical protein
MVRLTARRKAAQETDTRMDQLADDIEVRQDAIQILGVGVTAVNKRLRKSDRVRARREK